MIKITLLVVACWVNFLMASAQNLVPLENFNNSYTFLQKFNKEVYNLNSRFHSSIKSYKLADSLLFDRSTISMKLGVDTSTAKSWLGRKLTREHLFQVSTPEYAVYADFLPDFIVGQELDQSKNVWKNTRGFQIAGAFAKNFSFYTNVFENQAVFPNYLESFIDSNQVVPSEMTGKLKKRVKDWSYVTALLTLRANKYLDVALGYDKNFVGDGYRSMLLSDVAANYSFLRLRVNIGNVQYQTIFAYMLDPGSPRLSSDRRLGDRAKWNAMH